MTISKTQLLLEIYLTPPLATIAHEYMIPLADSRFAITSVAELTSKSSYWSSHSIIQACEVGHYELVSIQIPRVTNHSQCLEHACRLNYYDIAMLIIRNGKPDINLGLYGACDGGHLHLAKAMIGCGAVPACGLDIACARGHREIVNEIIKYTRHNLSSALSSACASGYMEIANMMITLGAQYCSTCRCTAWDHRKSKNYPHERAAN